MPVFFFRYSSSSSSSLKASCCCSKIWAGHSSRVFADLIESDGGSMAVCEIRWPPPSLSLPDWKAPPLRRGLPGKERLVNLSFVPWCLFHRLPRPFITVSPVPPSVALHCYANAAAAPCSSPPGLICYVMLMSCHAKCRRRRRGMFRRKQWVSRFFPPLYLSPSSYPVETLSVYFQWAWIQAE